MKRLKMTALSSPVQIRDLRLLSRFTRSCFLFVLIANVGELPSAYWVANVMDLDHRTVVRYLKELENAGYIEHIPGEYGYRLVNALNESQKRLLALFMPDQPAGE